MTSWVECSFKPPRQRALVPSNLPKSSSHTTSQWHIDPSCISGSTKPATHQFAVCYGLRIHYDWSRFSSCFRFVNCMQGCQYHIRSLCAFRCYLAHQHLPLTCETAKTSSWKQSEMSILVKRSHTEINARFSPIVCPASCQCWRNSAEVPSKRRTTGLPFSCARSWQGDTLRDRHHFPQVASIPFCWTDNWNRNPKKSNSTNM